MAAISSAQNELSAVRGDLNRAAESIYQLSQREGVEMPLCRSVYEVLYHGVAVQDVVSSLMRRAKKDELTETTWL